MTISDETHLMPSTAYHPLLQGLQYELPGRGAIVPPMQGRHFRDAFVLL